MGGACNCQDGYEAQGDSLSCKEKPNVLMIALFTIGSAICMALGVIICTFIRMRGSQQIHAENRKRNTQGNAEIEIYYSADDPQHAMENTSNMFWNSKSYEYKPE